jgi:hypothetical protein
MVWRSGARSSARSLQAANRVVSQYVSLPSAVQTEAAPAYPVRYEVQAAGRQSRLRVGFRLVLALPQLIALQICLYLIYLLTAVAWLIGIFSGRYDRGLASLPQTFLDWYARVLTYVSLLRDEYPPFGGGPYPIAFDAPLQERQSRKSIFFRAILILPHLLIFSFVLSLVWAASVTLAWFALLISGRYPEGLRRLVIGLNRWLLRIFAYALLLRGDYPPFSLGLNEAAPAVLPAYAYAPEDVSYPPAVPSWPPREAEQPEAAPVAETLVGGAYFAPRPAARLTVTSPETLPGWPEPRQTATVQPEEAAWHDAKAEHAITELQEAKSEASRNSDADTATSPNTSAGFFRPRREPPPS